MSSGLDHSNERPPTGEGPERVARGEAGYPARLSDLPQPPEALWVSGQLPAAEERLVAIVGARAATGAGCRQARDLAHALGAGGMGVVSGGAFGIDAAAHQGALLSGAATYAVLGCGVDVVYPDRHAALFGQIAASGGLLSEYPPGTPPRRGQFPARNRLIAALAQAVIVVEALHRSGALITARLGRALERPLLAVPGSPGTDRLIATGQARPARSADEVEDALDGRTIPLPLPVLPAGLARSVVEALRAGGASPVELCQRTGLALPSVLAGLAEAELEGWVVRRTDGGYEGAHRGG